MSSDSTNQLLNYFKQLVKQLDTKFGSLEQQLDKIEANLDNLRAYNERFQSQMQSEMKDLKKVLSAQQLQTINLIKDETALDDLDSSKEIDFMSFRNSKPELKKFDAPLGPPPLDDFKPSPTIAKTGFQNPPPEINSGIRTPITEQPLESQTKTIQSSITSQYGGLKATPILDALKEEMVSDEGYIETQNKKKKVQKQTLQAYMEKLEGVIKSSLPKAQEMLLNEDSQGFIDKGLTVLHGIIEFLFVAYRLEFPDPSLDYYAKAKNISGQGLYKDVSLLEKMESIFAQIEREEKPVLAKPLLRGLAERINKIYEDFEAKLEEAYGRV
jgi:hypothetical protein